MKASIALQQHREAIRQIVERHHGRNARVFGSVLYGRDTDDSDLNILIPNFAIRYPDFPLRAAYGTRNALAHGYFKVDLGLVWKTVERDLPSLANQVSDVLQTMSYGWMAQDP